MRYMALGIILLLAGCGGQTGGIHPGLAARDERGYRYLHHETTGQMDYVVISGKEIPIEFSDDSDPRALALLKGLKSEIFLPNVGGQRASGGIFLVGHYEEGYSLSAHFRRLLGGEGYHLFTLKRWYATRPVLKDVFNQDMERVKSVSLERLHKTDFEGTVPTEVELSLLLPPGGKSN